MIIKGITEEDFVNYKKPAMYIAFPHCSFKCEKECGIKGLCQNSPLAKENNISVDANLLVTRYLNNPLTHSVVMAGLEPFDSLDDVLEFISALRKYCDDDVVIYTGYTEEESEDYIDKLKEFTNIIVKFGRFIPNQEHHFDEVLGVELASTNQYAKRLVSI